MSPRLLPFSLTSCLLLLGGCETLGYTAQAAFGHLDLMAKRQPISEIFQDNSAPDSLKLRLQQVAAIREFASRELGLPDNGSYRSYAALDGDYPVWNVWAAPEFDLEPRKSCFPVVGCVPYRGYYSKQAAEEYAAVIRNSGDDVSIAGVTAYSTLGFFDDPVTSTMLRLPDERLVSLIFHELAHQVVYVKNNATFNESFARAVEIEGTLRWLVRQKDESALSRYQSWLGKADIFFSDIKQAREALSRLYATKDSEADKRRLKQKIVEALRETHRQRTLGDPYWSAYDFWFAGDINNAKLSAVSTYFDDVSMFRELLRESGGSFPAFYEKVQAKAAQIDQPRLSRHSASTEPPRL